MKIFTDKGVYVQKNDMMYLFHGDTVSIPASIIDNFYGKGAVIIGDFNRYEFVYFGGEKEVEYFRECDWIIDYNEVKDLTEEETIALGISISEERNELAKKYNSMSISERMKNSEIKTRCDLLNYKMASLRDVLWYRQGHIAMEFPKEIDAQTDLVEERGFKSILKRIFRKK